ncbi:MAG: hypothetical protein DMG76_23455 [Acidobacteria bacterium]|nr:MAG: hypothetical protein DMG76_23455 [Acidobacteriota bacterium]
MSIRSAVRSFITLAVLSSLSSVALAQLVSPASAPDSSRQTPSERVAQSNTKDEPEPTPKSSAPAQEQTNPPSTVPGASSTQGKVQGTSNDRLFYALPNFLSLENAGQVSPLATKQKFSVVARSSFDYVVYPWYGFLAGISQAENSEPGFGQGFGGYGKRFASALADGTIENFMTGAVLPSLLHQDPRFFQSGKGSFTHRAGYAVSRTFVTRTDSGNAQFNYSEIVGSALSAALSTNTYHPRSTIIATKSGPRFYGSDRTLTNTASVWGSQLGYDTITIVVKEFWPDIHRKLSQRRKETNVAQLDSFTP